MNTYIVTLKDGTTKEVKSHGFAEEGSLFKFNNSTVSKTSRGTNIQISAVAVFKAEDVKSVEVKQ